MSVIRVGGRAFAAGLYWLERGGPGATARTARRLGRPWCVHHGERTGFAADDPAETLVPETLVPETLVPQETPGGLDPEGLPALALALLASIEGAFWMALVEGDADPAGGRRYALVKARGGTVLADGDEAFEDRAAAVAAFERARPLGWSLFATPGLREELGGAGPEPRAGDTRAGEVAALDPAALCEAADAAGGSIALARAASRRRWLRPAAAALGFAALAAIAVLWFERDALVGWLAGPETTAVAPAVRPAPEAAVAVDSAALIAACREALIAHPPFLPGWRIERIACAARFADPELAGLVPELAGRPALLVRWRLEDGHAEAVQRRVAERYLARWHAAAVAGARAWAAAPLGPVLRVVDTRVGDAPASSFIELRRDVDRAFGTGGARVGYARGAGGGWTVRIDEYGPLGRLGRLAGGIAGLEIVALARGEDTRAGAARAGAGRWRLEGRPAVPERVVASRLEALGVIGGTAGTGVGIDQPEKEADDGTRTHE